MVKAAISDFWEPHCWGGNSRPSSVPPSTREEAHRAQAQVFWYSHSWTQEVAIQEQKQLLSADLDRKMPGPGGDLSQQHPAPTVYQLQVPLGKRRKDELSLLTHFPSTPLPDLAQPSKIPCHLVTSVRNNHVHTHRERENFWFIATTLRLPLYR